MPLSHIGVIVVVNLVWGTNIVFSKIALAEFPPLMFATLRFLVLGILLVPLLRPVVGEMNKVIAASLAMGALHFTLIYIGLQRAEDIAGVAVATQLYVPFATLLSILFLGERIGWRRTLGISMAFGGVVWMSFDPAVLVDVDALALVSVGALMAAAGTILMKRITTAGVFQMQAWIAAISFPPLAAASFFFEQGQYSALTSASPLAWSILLYTVLGASLAGHGGMYWLLKRHDVSVISPTTLAATFVAVAFGVILFDEQLTRDVIIGGLVSLSGVMIVALRQPRRGPAPPASTPTIVPRRQRR